MQRTRIWSGAFAENAVFHSIGKVIFWSSKHTLWCSVTGACRSARANLVIRSPWTSRETLLPKRPWSGSIRHDHAVVPPAAALNWLCCFVVAASICRRSSMIEPLRGWPRLLCILALPEGPTAAPICVPEGRTCSRWTYLHSLDNPALVVLIWHSVTG